MERCDVTITNKINDIQYFHQSYNLDVIVLWVKKPDAGLCGPKKGPPI